MLKGTNRYIIALLALVLLSVPTRAQDEAYGAFSPYSMYGQAIIRGKETREAVVEVFRYISTEVSRRMCEQFYPELIFKDTDYTKKIKNFPQGIVYGDMKNSTPEEKERLLAKWTH